MFEFFFKYPRSVYARGHFALLGAWPAWVLVLLILAAAAGLAWLIRSRLAEAAPVMRSWRAEVIWGLETLLAALVLVLLWQPAITVAELKRQQNIIAVLVDDSRSMGITEDGSTRQAQPDSARCQHRSSQGAGGSHVQLRSRRQSPNRDCDVRRWRRRRPHSANRRGPADGRREHSQQHAHSRGERQLRTAAHPIY